MMLSEQSNAIIIQSEKEATKRELQWFCDQVIPCQLQDIHELVQDIIQHFQQQQQPQQPGSKPNLITNSNMYINNSSSNTSSNLETLPITSTNDIITGCISLTGTKIFKGELSVRFKGVVRKINIQPTEAYHLQQLDDVLNWMITTSSRLDKVSHQTHLLTVEMLKSQLCNIENGLNMALKSFVAAKDEDVFPNVSELNEKCFVPPLPEDLFVEFSISNKQFLCSLLSLDFIEANSSQSKSRKGNESKDNIYAYKSKSVRIVDELNVEVKSGKIQQLAKKITQAHCLIHELNMKFNVLV